MRVGSRLPLDECIVTNARDESAFRPAQDGIYGYAEDEVMLSLNCDGGHATATNPGASVASPAGREAKAAADEAAAGAADRKPPQLRKPSARSVRPTGSRQ